VPEEFWATVREAGLALRRSPCTEDGHVDGRGEEAGGARDGSQGGSAGAEQLAVSVSEVAELMGFVPNTAVTPGAGWRGQV